MDGEYEAELNESEGNGQNRMIPLIVGYFRKANRHSMIIIPPNNRDKGKEDWSMVGSLVSNWEEG